MSPALDGDAPVETADRSGAFPRLDDGQLAAFEAIGERRRVQRGDVLFREGDAHYDFFVILSGRVAIVEGYGSGRERTIGVHGERRFLGELNLLTRQAAFLTAEVIEDGEVLAVPPERLRELVTHDTNLGDLILRAFLLRRSVLIGLGAGFRIIGSRYAPDTRRIREFAARNRLPHHWIDLEKDTDAEALLRELGVSPEETPVVIWRGREVLRNPSNAELAKLFGLPLPRTKDEVCDLIVVGAGPAGLAAAVYGASEGLDTVALDARRHRRPGRDVLADRELSRLPGRRLRRRAHRPGRPAGREVRRRAHDPGPRHVARAARRPLRDPARWRPGAADASDRDRDRRAVPPAAGAGARGARGHERLLRRHA